MHLCTRRSSPFAMVAALVLLGLALAVGACASTSALEVETYVDADYGYSFDYPAGWVPEENAYVEMEGGASPESAVSVWDPDGATTGVYHLNLVGVSAYELMAPMQETMLPSIKTELDAVFADAAGAGGIVKVLEPLSETRVGELFGYETTVEVNVADAPVLTTLYFLFAEGEQWEYELMVQSSPEDWEAYQEVFAAFLASFQAGASAE